MFDKTADEKEAQEPKNKRYHNYKKRRFENKIARRDKYRGL